MTMPWMYYFGTDATLEQKLEGMTGSPTRSSHRC